MTKELILFIVFWASGLVAVCQTSFGLKAGFNLANQNKTTTSPQAPSAYKKETKPIFGYQLGTFYKASISSKFDLAAELNFSLIGSKNLYITERQILNPDGRSHYYNDKIGYVEIPLTLQYSFNDIYLGIGPSVAYKVFSEISNFEGNTYSGANYRKFDAAGNFLLGCRISKKLEMNLRYSYGILNIMEDPFNQTTKNRFVNFSLLYSIKHK